MSKNPIIARVIALVAVVIVGGGALVYAFMGKKMTTEPTQADVTTPVPGNSQTPSASGTSASSSTAAQTNTSVYKDGTYSATGSYISPGGDEKIGVTVTLKDDVITAASVDPEPVSSEGKVFQGIFQKNFQPLVIGKNIADVHLSEVSGSSLTSGGFNQALADIEAQAKA